MGAVCEGQEEAETPVTFSVNFDGVQQELRVFVVPVTPYHADVVLGWRWLMANDAWFNKERWRLEFIDRKTGRGHHLTYSSSKFDP